MMPFDCPKCGEATYLLHEGYCLQCCEAGQADLDRHNGQFDAWERMTDAQRDRAIKDAQHEGAGTLSRDNLTTKGE